jgi:hypothetical protein
MRDDDSQTFSLPALAFAGFVSYSARSSFRNEDKSVGEVTQTTAHIAPVKGATGDI